MMRAVAEPTRMRVLALLVHGELSVKDMTRILGQSQPRISRHLKLMTEAGLLERLPDGSWAYFQLAERGAGRVFVNSILNAIDLDDPVLARDRVRAETIKREREAAAQEYFQRNAPEWDRIRALHVAEDDVEVAVRDALDEGPFQLLVDLGTGTGRMLELFAGHYERAIGFDINHSMLAYARGRIEALGNDKASVRHSDLYDLALDDGEADAVVMHQVLHFLTEPALAMKEAARVLAPGGRMVIVDFAPHNLNFLREDFAHERLGIANAQMEQWLADAELDLVATRCLEQSEDGAAGRLTVTLWTARNGGVAARPKVRGEQSTIEA
ncbi:MAG: ArsR/SmtB family transcription factor [Hyphomicrobiaceae bacterium]